MKASILLIEGKRSTRPSFQSGLINKGYAVSSVPNGSSALTFLTGYKPHVILVDSASMRTNGKRICQSLRDCAPGIPVIVIADASSNSAQNFPAEVVLYEPFTLQKLVNRIKTFVPNEKKNSLSAGPIELDLDQRLVRCGTKQSRLTPRLASLLKMFLEKPGELIERQEIFQKVWETEYLGDTRPLDVHISWLRQKIEDDPRKPQFIKTIRGVGYRLDVEIAPTKKRSFSHST